MKNLCLRTAGALAMVIAGSQAVAAAGSPSLAAGRKALAAGDLASALPLFEAAQREAEEARDRDGQADAAFYSGLTLQRQAERASGPEAEVLRRRTVEAYRKALDLRPAAPATANNLAQALVALNEADAALGVLQAAAAAADPPAYLSMNRAELLLRKDDWKGAVAAYQAALKAEPHNDAAETALFDLRRTRDPAALPAHLWALVDAKRVTLAVSRALTLLRAGGDTVPARSRPELLAVIAAACSQQFYDPARWLTGDTARGLQALAGDPVIGAGAVQLLQLHQPDPPPRPDAYRWWANHSDLGQEAQRGVWPLDAFRMLVRALARWHRTAGADRKAEALYLLSTHLSPREPDPTALLELADMLAAGGRLAQLEALMQKEEPGLFYGKGEAYRRSQMAAIYDYHRSMGVIYSYIGRLGGGSPATAEFQLEHALEIARSYNRRSPGEPIQVEPRLYELLATIYEKTGREDQAGGVRIAAVEDALDRKDVKAAAQLAAPLQLSADTMRAADRVRWQRVNLSLGVAAASAAAALPAGSAGSLIREVELKGIVRTPTGHVAMLLAADGRSYFVREGQRLFDGVVTKIDATDVTFQEEVSDPLSTVRSREVKKTLYPEGRQF